MIVDTAQAQLDAGRIEAVARAAEEIDGVAPLGEQPLRALYGDADFSDSASDAASDAAGSGGEAGSGGAAGGVRHLVAWAGAGAGVDDLGEDGSGGHLIGYAQIDGTGRDATAELVVHPDHRRQGIGAGLVRAVIEREPAVSIWAHGALPAATELAEKLGLIRNRELLKMRRRGAYGPALPERTPVAGIELGTLAEAASEGGTRWPGLDARAEFLRVNNAAFHWHPEQGGWSRDMLDDRLAVDWVDTGAVSSPSTPRVTAGRGWPDSTGPRPWPSPASPSRARCTWWRSTPRIRGADWVACSPESASSIWRERPMPSPWSSTSRATTTRPSGPTKSSDSSSNTLM